MTEGYLVGAPLLMHLGPESAFHDLSRHLRYFGFTAVSVALGATSLSVLSCLLAIAGTVINHLDATSLPVSGKFQSIIHPTVSALDIDPSLTSMISPTSRNILSEAKAIGAVSIGRNVVGPDIVSYHSGESLGSWQH